TLSTSHRAPPSHHARPPSPRRLRHLLVRRRRLRPPRVPARPLSQRRPAVGHRRALWRRHLSALGPENRQSRGASRERDSPHSPRSTRRRTFRFPALYSRSLSSPARSLSRPPCLSVPLRNT
ncbi:uncharacterized protein RHOBADRAFT_50946, partial [Rhodotorula graminis WP1]